MIVSRGFGRPFLLYPENGGQGGPVSIDPNFSLKHFSL
jgi:hypothetical protein